MSGHGANPIFVVCVSPLSSFKQYSVISLGKFIFCIQVSEMSFSYSVTEATGLAVSGSWDFGDQPMKTYRTIIIVPIEKWRNVLKTIKEMVEI